MSKARPNCNFNESYCRNALKCNEFGKYLHSRGIGRTYTGTYNVNKLISHSNTFLRNIIGFFIMRQIFDRRHSCDTISTL